MASIPKRIASFISIIAITTLIVIASTSLIKLNILVNLYGLNKNLIKLEKQSLVECLMMQRIKYECESMSYNEDIIYYDGVTIIPHYDFEDVEITYIFEDYEIIRTYHYDLNTKTISID